MDSLIKLKKLLANLENKEHLRLYLELVRKLYQHLDLPVSSPHIALTLAIGPNYRVGMNLNARLMIRLQGVNGTDEFLLALYYNDIQQISDQLPGYDPEKWVFKPHKGEKKSQLIAIPVSVFLENRDRIEKWWLAYANDYLPRQKASNYLRHHVPELVELAFDPSRVSMLVNEPEKYFFSRLMERHKSMYMEPPIPDEIYKWRAVKTFQDYFDPDAEDFHLMIREALSDTHNLIYQNSMGFIRKASEFYPDEYRNMLLHLYDEDVSLAKRYAAYEERAAQLAPRISEKLGKTFNHQQDERTLSALMSLRYPDRYPLYKNDVYLYLLDAVFFEQPRPAREKYLHFIRLGKKMLPLIQEDKELEQIIRAHLDDTCYQGDISWLLFQDIVWLNKARDSEQEAGEPGTDGEPGSGAPAEPGDDDEKIIHKHRNIILYGPPGTGKTYNTVNHALSIIKRKSLDAIRDEEREYGRESLVKQFDSYRENGRIVFTTFHQSMSYEDFIEGIKPRTIHDQVSSDPDDDRSIGEISYHIEPGIFRQLCERASEESSADKSYVLIIDEINRGNIAQIFGELITLIEDDKRAGQAEALTVTLPYSKSPFTVPPNLYIIGTMNTADRSVEALDTALRRRFSFEEIRPDPDIISKSGELAGQDGVLKIGGKEYSLPLILGIINHRIEKLLDKDHQIGHSYFLKIKSAVDMQEVFRRNIMPLLEEFFYGDKGKIQLILGKGFVMLQNNPGLSTGSGEEGVLFPDTDYEESDLLAEKPVWLVKDQWLESEEELGNALDQLLAGKRQ